MYLKVRKLNANPGDSDIIVNVSKNCFIKDVRKIIHEKTGIEVDKQRLYYKGKQMIDEHRVVDYDIQLNDVIQLMIKSEVSTNSIDQASESQEEPSTSAISDQIKIKCESKYYKVGDAIEFQNPYYGSWFEAHIVDIFQANDTKNVNVKNKEPEVLYKVQVDLKAYDIISEVTYDLIRPRSYYKYKLTELIVGDRVLVNYSAEDPDSIGYWYDCIVEKVTSTTLQGTILIKDGDIILEDCKIKFIDNIFRIENGMLLTEQTTTPPSPPLRQTAYYCNKCKDKQSKLCKSCGCAICAGKNDVDQIILCDECDCGFHIKCLTPPLKEVPSELEWFCPDCKRDENEIVKAGDKLKFSRKKANRASGKQLNPSRDWGRGMACVGRTKECTIVPKDHYGPIPGIEVGTCWKFRLQVSEAGIHRPHVAGIHGRETDGAYSLVLSGGYEDDCDNGEEFTYSGSGGRDLSGNKRISEQSSNQELSRMNKALALNCNVPLNENGAEAKDWKNGKPVRVVRNYKLGKISKYAPKDGNRYDGIYKVVKYYPGKGKSGYIVWKYVLRRDDPIPPPWSKKGKELDMLYPPGYLEAHSSQENIPTTKGIKRNRSSTSPQSNKKKKVEPYRLNREILLSIKKDDKNDKLWNECKQIRKEGKLKFLNKIEELFMCVCCQELVHLPITTECRHNICKFCLERSFNSRIYNCPHCRFELGRDFKMDVNTNLSSVLVALFPGYEAGR